MRSLVILLRHLMAILILPFTVTVIVPRWLLQVYGERPVGSGEAVAITGCVAGAAIFAVGIALFAWCLYLFATRGRGTLAPWDPPRKLVVVGPYKYVRNPMISAVLMILLGEAVFHRSKTLFIWLLFFFALNAAYFMVFEEPDLERRFGEDYRAYKKDVPRWIPRPGRRKTLR